MPEYMALVKYEDDENGGNVCFQSFFADTQDGIYDSVTECIRHDRCKHLVAEEYYHRVNNSYIKIA